MTIVESIFAALADQPEYMLCAVDAPGIRRWQMQARKRLWRLLGRMPEPVELQPRINETLDAGDHLRQRVYYRISNASFTPTATSWK